MTVLFAMCFSSLSMFIASLLRTRDRMMGIGQAITIPLFFASSAIYPLSLMPQWLRAFALINPLTYVVDALTSDNIARVCSESSPGHRRRCLFATVLFMTLASLAIKRLIE